MIRFLGRRRRALQVVAVGIGLAVVGVGIAVAEDVWVSRAFVEVRAGKGSWYPVVFKADKGAKMAVVDHEGNWIKVLYNGQTGYLLEDALSTHEVHPELMAAIKGSDSSGASAASAGKGFTPTEFANAKGLSEEPLKKFEANEAAAFTPQAFEKFMADGKVGQGKSTTRP